MSKVSTTDSSDYNIEYIKEKTTNLEVQIFKCKSDVKKEVSAIKKDLQKRITDVTSDTSKEISDIKKDLQKRFTDVTDDTSKEISTMKRSLQDEIEKVNGLLVSQTQKFKSDKKLFMSKIKELEDVNTHLRSNVTLLQTEFKKMQSNLERMTGLQSTDFNQIAIIPKTNDCKLLDSNIKVLNKRIMYFEIKNLLIITFIIIIIILNNFGYRLY